MGVDILAIFKLFSLRLYLVEVLEASTLWAVFDFGLAMINLVCLFPDPINQHVTDNIVLYNFLNELLLINGD